MREVYKADNELVLWRLTGLDQQRFEALCMAFPEGMPDLGHTLVKE